MPTPRRRRYRLASWLLLALLLGVDAAVSTNISLGLLYFLPLTVGAMLLGPREAILLAVACGMGRVLFGPVGDPLGLEEISYRVPSPVQAVVNGLVSMTAYVGVALVLSRLRSQQRRLEQLDQEVETDPLTGVANRRALARFLAEQRGRQVSVLAMDLDHFKRVNDAHGHEGGDRVLQQLATRLVNTLRGSDLVVRTGGEEFVAVLPQADVATAEMVAGRVVAAVRGQPFALPQGPLQVTLSVGFASGPAGEELLALADRALYRAKQEGRDRAVAA